MAPVYSEVLWWQVDISAATEVSPEVPPGIVWVIREIDVATTYGNWSPGQPLVFATSLGTPIATVGADPYDPASPRNHWQGRVVLESGDYMTCEVIGNAWSWRVSGYALTLP